MRYFDPGTVFLARHAQHIVLVHFPIALLISSVLFDLLARWTRHQALAAAGALNLYAAAFTAPLAALTGLLAWRWQLEGARLKGALLLHMCFGIAVMLGCVCLAWFRLRRPPEPASPLPWAFHLAGLLSILAVAATAHLGGILSGVVIPAN